MNVALMSSSERIGEVLRRSKKHLGPDAGKVIDSLLEPKNLAIVTGTLVVWAGSHFFGVGEIVDVLLLVVGAYAIGWSITDVASDLYKFGDLTLNAHSDGDLDKAAEAFSHAVVLAGITVVMALLLRRSVKQVQAARGPNVMEAMRPRSPGLPKVSADPARGSMWSKPPVTGDPTMPAGTGATTPYGVARFSTSGSVTQQLLARAHEIVHQFFTPRVGILRTFRVRLRTSGYLRSALLKYLEEALAETVAQLRVIGLSGLLEGLRFPVANGYVSINALFSEGAALGTIVAGTLQFIVQFVPMGPDPDCSSNAACSVGR